eukprot:s1043_g6.t1
MQTAHHCQAISNGSENMADPGDLGTSVCRHRNSQCLGDAFGIILLVPLYEKVIFPAIRRYRGYHLNRSTKYVLGFSFAIAANLSAALLEHLRRSKSTAEVADFVLCPEELIGSSSCSNGYLLSKCSPGASLPMTRMSAFWMGIPMFLTGAGEILVNPVVYQYVFEEAPAPLRSMLQALNLVAAGSISNAITAALSPLVPENLNDGMIVYFYYVNCIVALVTCRGSTDSWGALSVEKREEPVTVKIFSHCRSKLCPRHEWRPRELASHAL